MNKAIILIILGISNLLVSNPSNNKFQLSALEQSHLLSTFSIFGEVRSPYGGIPTRSIKVQLFLNGALFRETNVDSGRFEFKDLPDDNKYELIADVESQDNPLNGVSTADFVKIQRHLLGLVPFTQDYQRLAADVNQKNGATVADLVEILKLILGTMDEFSSKKSWIIYPEKFYEEPNYKYYIKGSIYIDKSKSSISHNFTILKLGDVNGSATN
ncbi:MAG: hypothetical protein U0V49_08000 [Saprospiraceae bacterium]